MFGKLDSVKSQQGKKNKKFVIEGGASGDNFDVDKRTITQKAKDFAKSIKNSSVFRRAEKMQQIANKRNLAINNADRSIKNIASEVKGFLGEDKSVVLPLLNALITSSAPTTMNELAAYAEKANTLYASVDYRNSDISNEGKSYRDGIRAWREEFIAALYTLRDNLIKSDASSLSDLSIVNQFQKLNPGAPVPSFITEKHSQLGVIMYGGVGVINDCGNFANMLIDELDQGPMISLFKKIEEEGLKEPEVRKELQNIIDNGSSKDAFYYTKSEKRTYAHHFKTAIGTAANGKVYSIEANVARPFSLAAELYEYSSEDDYQERSDETVNSRSRTGNKTTHSDKDIANMPYEEILEMIKTEATKSLGKARRSLHF